MSELRERSKQWDKHWVSPTYCEYSYDLKLTDEELLFVCDTSSEFGQEGEIAVENLFPELIGKTWWRAGHVITWQETVHG